MIRRNLSLWFSVLLGAALTGCVSRPSLETSQLSPLQVRAIETRSYDHQDTKALLKTVMNVLEDEGFLVDYGNVELGLLHASRQLGGRTTGDAYSFPVDAFALEGNRPAGSMATLVATANVSKAGKQIKVRVNFQRTIAQPTFFSGAIITTAAPINDPRIYQEFFAKLDRGLFIQKQGL